MKSTLVVGAFTLISRILGFVRDMMIARYFGADWATDAFFVAFRLPNLMRRLFFEGAFAQGFVPALARQNEDSNLKNFIDRMSGMLVLILFGTSFFSMLLASFLIYALAPGFIDQASHELSVELLRIMLPYLFFLGLSAFLSSILNSQAQFAIPALMPAVLNISMIAAMLWLKPHLNNPIEALAWGVLLGGCMQTLLQLPSLARLGLLPRLKFQFADLEVKAVLKNLLPAIFGVSAGQVNLLLGTLIASFLASGSISWLYYSDRLVEFPLGILGVALSTVILPQLSRHHADRSLNGFSESLDLGLRWTLLISLPATLGLMLLAEPLIGFLFEGEAFHAFDVKMASLSLAAYALGLPGLIAIKILASGFSARSDFKTPLRYGFYSILINLILSLGFALKLTDLGLGHVGIALASALAALMNAFLLFLKLKQEKILILNPGWLIYLMRLFLANSAMVWLLNQPVLIGDLFMFVLASIGVYCLSLYILGLRPIHLY